MKKIMNFFVFVAAAAMALTSCQKSEIENVKPQEYEYTFLIGNADTKATIGDNCVEWESGDQIGVYTKVAAGTVSNNAYGNITPGTPATMKMYSNQALAIGDYIYAYYPYYSGNTNGELTVTMTIPASQTGKNDMPMVANPHCVESAIANGQQDAPAGKLQFANLGSVIEFNVYSTEYATEYVSSVSFAADKALAGTFSIDLENVDYSNPSTLAISGYSEKTVVSSLSTPVAVGADKATATKVKMVVAPGSYSGTVVVTTDKATYTYNIGTEKEFARSSVKQLGVNLDNGEREEIVNLEPEIDYSGTYAILAKRTTGGYYYMTSDLGTASTKRFTAESAGDACPEDGVELPASKLWEVSLSGDVYNVRSIAVNQYITHSGTSNSANLDEVGLGFTITKNDDGTYKLHYTAADEERYLSLNKNTGNNYFAMYESGQCEDLYLIPAVQGEEEPVTLVSIEVSGAKTEYVVGDNFVEPTVTATYSDGTTADVKDAATFTGYNMEEAGTYTVTVTYEGQIDQYSITVSEESTGGGEEGEEIVIFKESFGDNSSSARAWSDTYKEQSGIEAVYSTSTYVMTNVKQCKNTMGHVKSGINQSSSNSPAFFEVKNLSVENYSNFKVSYYWKAGSIKATYYTKLYYSIDGGNTYTEIVKDSGEGATTYKEVTYTLPNDISTSSLSLKVEFSTSNTQASIDEFVLSATN